MLLEAARSHTRSLQESPKPSDCGQATGPSLGWWLILKPPRYVRRGGDTHGLHLWCPGLTPGLWGMEGCNCVLIRKARPPEQGRLHGNVVDQVDMKNRPSSSAVSKRS